MDQDDRFRALIDEGLAASQADRRRAALELFTQASELCPSSGIPHFLLGSEHAAAGDMAAAEEAFANAVLLAPDFVLARYQLGLLQFSGGRVAMALLTWEPLHALPDDQSLGQFVRGFTALAQGERQEALERFQAGQACPDANIAVAADIVLVMNALRRPGDSQEPPAPDADDGHVLLAAYARGLH
jgi:tetratricopeptide (TPR) repeat protein